jgi:dUTP pyrophosphatase
MIIDTTLLKPEALLPEKKYDNDAGADIYFPEKVILKAKDVTVVNIEIAVDIPQGHFGWLVSRTSGAKNKLFVQAPPIDANYNGPIHAIIWNANDHDFEVPYGIAICQIVVVPSPCPEYKEKGATIRRTNSKFGQTGKSVEDLGGN